LKNEKKKKTQDKNKQKIEEITQCPKCNSTCLTEDYSRAELVCENCGLVIDAELIDHSPEWRAYDSEQQRKKARTGSPMTYTIHDKGLSTTIGWQNKDAYGKAIPTRNRAQMYRLRKWHIKTRISDGTERNLAIALSTLDRMSSALSLPRTVRETAAMIYRKAVTKKLIRGRSIDGITAAVLYAACRQCNVPRTLEEISNVIHMPKKEIGRNYRQLARKLELKLVPTTPQDYISRFCSELKMSRDAQATAMEILQKAAAEELTSGRGPTSMAAAALYLAALLCGEKITQSDIARIAGVTEVTIRNRYKEITTKLDINIPL
jgi:transcription initiation factor TFIIB